jgi:hypothetical protein
MGARYKLFYAMELEGEFRLFFVEINSAVLKEFKK